MVALQVLVLSVQVRILVRLQRDASRRAFFIKDRGLSDPRQEVPDYQLMIRHSIYVQSLVKRYYYYLMASMMMRLARSTVAVSSDAR